ncbi:arsenate reductase (glutaredoxin) [Winogradskyella maritima]|uniref:Arsenate reductase (Glutaredoxin) n=1 Tax=Winogradskyella maritima TaxID=1517766 RepID=A0ABV8AL65_9FLAO|nr:arsenate reductase (glutaredoxin) [Winogradskyella maritima]
MIEIYHNPRCTKSRQGVALLEQQGVDFTVVKYLDDKLIKSELKAIIEKLDIPPIDLVRKNEAIWKADYKGKDLTDDDIIDAMVNYPKLVERPIVVVDDKAVIGRPTERILELI